MPSKEKKAIVVAEKVSKKFGSFAALSDISIYILENEVFGLLGPNGAGKSTLSKILMGMMDADSGNVRFFGADLKKQHSLIKGKVAIVPQDIAAFYSFSVKQNLDFFGTLYGIKGQELKKRREYLLEWLQLKQFENRKVENLSGGYQRLLNIACSLVHDPRVIFFDEPTVGLDPKMRKLFWEIIETLKDDGKTICITTHYMDEAEHLCDRVGIINQGKLLVCESPKKLIEEYGGFKVLVVMLEKIPESDFVEALKRILIGSEVTSLGNAIVIALSQEHSLEKISMITDFINAKGYEIKSSTLREPELEDVFINLTGRKLKD
ncbi:MAG: ABC transporter ATP-binding protein [Candidatus Diapherotrites archaeon]|nr:ABC transporter ATP-binding protein [Candidatus Diapherotrites archaeon]